MFKKLVVPLILSFTIIYAVDYRKTHAAAWETNSLNKAAMLLYGKQKFSTMKQTPDIELITPKALVEDSQTIPINIRSKIPAKSVALFVDKQDKALITVLDRDNFEEVDLSLNIRMERKGTLFVVIETMNGKLLYTRAFIDILCLPCLAK